MKSQVEKVLSMPLSDKQYSMLQEDWNAFVSEPTKYSNYASMVIDYLNKKPKGKIEVLQEVLRASLNAEQISYLKEYWKAFYNNPKDYENDRIIGFIVEDMGLTQFEEKEICKMEFDWKKFIELNPDLVAKVSEDKTLAYNKNGVYVRIIDKTFTFASYHITPYRTSGVNVNYAIWEDDNSTLIVAVPSDVSFDKDSIFTEMEFIGYTAADGAMFNPSEIEFFSYAYVPFINGPQGSKIPVMWRTVTGNTSFGGLTLDSISEAMATGKPLNDMMKSLAEYIATKYPSVDLKEQKDQRFISLAFQVANNTFAYFTYNRNHVAYNGNIDGELKTLAILCAVADYHWQNVVNETLIEYLDKDYHNNLIVSTQSARVVKETESEPSPVIKEEKELEIETNPLIRAAKLAGGGVK